MRSLKRLVLALAAAVGLALLSAPASAQSATGPGANAVVAKRNQIANTAVGRDYFANVAPETRQPMWTPDGGVYQYWTGPRGRGAVYWTAKTGAHYIYGNVLTYYELNGHEEELGYPIEDPQIGPGVGCMEPDVRLRQTFAMPTTRSALFPICAGPAGAYPGVPIL